MGQIGSSPRSGSQQQRRHHHHGNHHNQQQQSVDLMMMSSPQHQPPSHQSRNPHRGVSGGRLPVGSKSPSASSQSEPSYPDGMEPYSTLSGRKNKKTLPSNFLKVNHNLSYIVEFMGIVVVARVEFHLNLLNKVRERTLLEGGRGIEAAPLFTRLEKWSTTNWFLMKGGERIV